MSATRALPRKHADPATRAAILASARECLDWLEANPGVPLGAWGHDWLVGANGPEQVEDLALEMGVPAEHNRTAHRAVKRFGPVAYVAYAANLDVTK